MKSLIFNTTRVVLLLLFGSVILFTGCPKNGNNNKGATKNDDSTYRVITVAANPTTIKTNATSKITAHVVDNEYWSTSNWIVQPIESVEVTFTAAPADCGKLSAAKATTNNNGDASVTFTPFQSVTPPCL